MRRRLDRYDLISLVLLALVAALWSAHFVLPAGPPPTELPQ
ncbi:MAG: hypothetical protein ACREFQ_06915 [Stellaceae bacterium]